MASRAPRGALAALLVALLLAACGNATRIPQTGGQPPFRTATVTVEQTGDAPVAVDRASASFSLDASGSLTVHVVVRSTAAVAVTVVLRASLFSPSGALVGDATGGSLSLAPGASQAVELNGPRPNGTIARAVFETTALARPSSAG